MNILVVEPFYIESHKEWLDNLIKYSSHRIEKLTLKGHHWKWRMHGGAVTMAQEYRKLQFRPDLILCTDMLDLSVFSSLLRKEIAGIPLVLYFHENQLCYPWSPSDEDVTLKRDRHYAFINYTSALTADYIFFNSNYHQNAFIDQLSFFLNEFPDHKNLESIDIIEQKSALLYLGTDLKKFDPFQQSSENQVPILLWNHRWEYDKNPELFFNTLFKLKSEGFEFELIVLGRSYPQEPEIFKIAKSNLANEIIHWGYAENFSEYAALLWKADILPVCSKQDFFGISVVEAIYCGCIPLLPDRLSYPEHIMEKNLFYKNESEFENKLKSLIRKHGDYPSINLEKIKSYDWSHQIMGYDDAFSKLSSNFAGK